MRFEDEDLENQVTSTNEDNQPGPQDNGKIIFCAMLVGFILIVIALLGNNFLNKGKEKAQSQENTYVTNSVNTSQQYVEKDVTVNNNVDVNKQTDAYLDATAQTPITIGKPVGNSDVEMVPNETQSEWLPFTVKYYGEQSAFIESVFTVSNIAGYAKTNGTNGVLKHSITGSIQGLDGTYELEVSYDIALKLKVGTSFKVWYSTINVGGTQFVSEIKTENN